MDSLPIRGGAVKYKPLPLSHPSNGEVYRLTRKMLSQLAHSPDALLGVLSANFGRLENGDIDLVFPDKKAAAWLRAMHLLVEIAARLYEQNPYEFSRLEKIAQSLDVIERYIKTNRHCPIDLKEAPSLIN